jgi:hypothetical protein
MSDRTKSQIINACVEAIVELFPDVPHDYLHCGQTFEQRADAWVRNAIEELEEELACGGDDEDEDT